MLTNQSLSTVVLSCAYVDGTFLTGKYKGQILTAIGVDVENRVVPIAFAFIESENTDSWLWFLRHVKIGVVGDISNVCIIHGRHAGLLSAVHKCKQTRMSRVHGQTCIADGVCDTWGPTSSFCIKFLYPGSSFQSLQLATGPLPTPLISPHQTTLATAP